MTTNAIAISRGFVEAGIEKKAADAIAEAVVTHADETSATKADLARLEGKIESRIAQLEGEIRGEIKALAGQVKMLIGLVIGLYVGLGVFLVNPMAG